MAKKTKSKESEPVESRSNRVRRFITLTPRRDEMAEEIMAEKGHGSFSEFIGAAIELYHDEITKSQFYRSKSTKGGSPAASKRMSDQAEENQRLHICDELGGEVKENADGSKVCVYYTYVGRKRYEQEVSLGLLDRAMLKSQYTPSKEAVLKLQKEGKVEYETKK